MNDKYYRIKNSVFCQIGNLFVAYKRYLLVFGILFLISVLTGVLTASKYSSVLEQENLINRYFHSFVCNDINFFGFFLMMSLIFVAWCLVIVLLTRNTFFVVVNVLIFMLFAYIFGFDLCVVIICFGLIGVILGLLVQLIFGVLIFVVIMLLLAISIKRFRNHNLCRLSQKNEYLHLYLWLTVVGLVLLFLFCLSFSIFHIFVIVG